MVVRALVLVLATPLAHTILSLVNDVAIDFDDKRFYCYKITFQVTASKAVSYKDQYWYGGQSTGSGSGNTIGSHNAQSG